MKIEILNEPELEFSGGTRHIDPRHGVADYGPADATNTHVRTIRAGIVGSRENIDGLKRWLDKCRLPISAKESRLGHLFVPFPGFDTHSGFRSTIIIDSRLERPIRDRDLRDLATRNPAEAVHAAVDLYMEELEALNEEPSCDVILIARPDNLVDRVEPPVDPQRPWRKEQADPLPNFRTLLKARAMRFSRPLQIVRRTTWDPSFKPPGTTETRRLQDEATRAWNIHTALYYKAGGVPWRLTRDPSDLTSCYVGITFYRSDDATTMQTSVAQVFNQRGDGVIVRGAPAPISRHDKQPHLAENDAQALIAQALKQYRTEHRTLPARLVLHKTSDFTPDEISGFEGAADAAGVDTVELLWFPGNDNLRLFRTGNHPPLRGTFVSLGEKRHVLYTRGSVPFYKTYPGMYVPQPLAFRTISTESSPTFLAEELLALTKMNWNQTQMDQRDPITLRTADNVGDILKHIPPEDRPQGRYAFYM